MSAFIGGVGTELQNGSAVRIPLPRSVVHATFACSVARGGSGREMGVLHGLRIVIYSQPVNTPFFFITRVLTIDFNCLGGPLLNHPVCALPRTRHRNQSSLAGGCFLNLLLLSATLLLIAQRAACAQDADTPGDGGATVAASPHTAQPVESEATIEGLASYGHYKIFASGSDCHLYTGGVEYDRNSWGNLLGAQVDYVAELLPLVLLDAPLTQDIWGSPTSPYHHVVPGVGFSPIGFRLLWRRNRAIKPYLTAKGGMLIFSQKALSQKASYANFSLQSAGGVEVRLTPQFDLRLGLFSDFHFSNDFIVPVNPGIDVMNANLGLTYHFKK